MISSLIQSKQYDRAVGIDTSTHSLAFCVLEYQDRWNPVYWGKVDIESIGIAKTCGKAASYLPLFLDVIKPDIAFIEAPVFVNSKVVTIKLSKVVGATTGAAEACGVSTYEVTPIAWMNYIGNPTRDSPAFKKAMQSKTPGKPKTWYKQESRRLRKARTRAWVEQEFGLDIDDDDVTDAFGIAWYGVKEIL